MLSVKGTFQNGVVHPSESIEGREGQPVIIVFVEEDNTQQLAPKEDSDWDKLRQLIKDCAVDTGIDDLAHHHDPASSTALINACANSTRRSA